MDNINFSPLPFFDSLDKQDFRKEYAHSATNRYIGVPVDTLMPFQFTIAKGDKITKAEFFNKEDGKATDITQQLMEAGLTVLDGGESFDNALFPADKKIKDSPFKIGPAYLIITTDSGKYYSEYFTLISDTSGYLKMSWRSSRTFDLPYDRHILFGKGFTFWMLVPTELSNPTYSFTEQASERMGYTFIESQVSKKSYNFSFIATEPLMDALRLARMCPLKAITNRGERYVPTDFTLDVSWTAQPNFCSCDVSFSTDDVLVRNRGGYNNVKYIFTSDYKDPGEISSDGKTIGFMITSRTWDGQPLKFTHKESDGVKVDIIPQPDKSLSLIHITLEKTTPETFTAKSVTFTQEQSGLVLEYSWRQGEEPKTGYYLDKMFDGVYYSIYVPSGFHYDQQEKLNFYALFSYSKKGGEKKFEPDVTVEKLDGSPWFDVELLKDAFDEDNCVIAIKVIANEKNTGMFQRTSTIRITQNTSGITRDLTVFQAKDQDYFRVYPIESKAYGYVATSTLYRAVGTNGNLVEPAYTTSPYVTVRKAPDFDAWQNDWEYLVNVNQTLKHDAFVVWKSPDGFFRWQRLKKTQTT